MGITWKWLGTSLFIAKSWQHMPHCPRFFRAVNAVPRTGWAKENVTACSLDIKPIVLRNVLFNSGHAQMAPKIILDWYQLLLYEIMVDSLKKAPFGHHQTGLTSNHDQIYCFTAMTVTYFSTCFPLGWWNSDPCKNKNAIPDNFILPRR